MTTFKVVRGYFDRPYWGTEIDAWAEKYGDTVIIGWATSAPTRMHPAAERLVTDVTKRDSTFTHDGCELTEKCIGAARKSHRPGGRYVLDKPGDGRKIDLAVVSILAHEAACDVTAKDLWPVEEDQNFAYFI